MLLKVSSITRELGTIWGPRLDPNHCWRQWMLVLAVVNSGCNRPIHVPTNAEVAHSQPHESAQIDELAEPGESSQPGGRAVPPQPPMDRASVIERIEDATGREEFAEAERLLRQLLVVDPDDVEVIFRFANLEAARGNLDHAISLLDAIPEDHPEAGVAALGQGADWCIQRQRFDDAEARYRKVLRIDPGTAMAHRQLAKLLNRQGRRHEAAAQIQELCRLGDVLEGELHALMSLSDAVVDHPDDEALAAGDDFAIGPEGRARVAFTQLRYAEAAELLRQACVDAGRPESVNAFLGRAIAEAQDERWFLEWLASTTPATQEYSEYWAALGTHLLENQLFAEAVRALAEALVRDPTDARSYRRLSQALIALGRSDAASTVSERYFELRRVVLAANEVANSQPPNSDDIAVLAAGLRKMNRPLEEILWRSVDGFYRRKMVSELSAMNDERLAVAPSERAFGLASERLCGLELDDYPIPDLRNLVSDPTRIANHRAASPLRDGSKPVPTPSFENIAQSIGLEHQFMVASGRQDNRFSIYQTLGGGVAVIDFDLDGNPDLYFCQGASDPAMFVGKQSNILYRSADGQLRDVTSLAQAAEYRYTIGTTAGDWNQDGFPDLVASNIGRNTLLVNQGDGTFLAVATDSLDDTTLIPSSLAIADVTGDALPDLVELNYVHDATSARKAELDDAGQVLILGPLDFTPGSDRILVNDQLGGRIAQTLDRDTKAAGLGLIVTNFDDQNGNEMFVGNDMAPDRLWKRNERGEWLDLAPTTGCALGSSGTTNASMGIAAADFDANGTLDLHITNFENQSVTFLLNRNGTFRDRAVQYKLARDSFPLLGFGCQPLDYDSDGVVDLVVSNGHVDDTGNPAQLYRQPPQFFVNHGDHFQLTQVKDASGYFERMHVGRAVARLDFNHDGLSDFVVTHMGSPSALLLNRTETSHHWLRIRLVGTSSERDAIGAVATIRFGGRQSTQWQIAGDGYLCHNESDLIFGTGDADVVDKLMIVWPDGMEHSLNGIATDQHLLVVQGDASPFALGRGPLDAR